MVSSPAPRTLCLVLRLLLCWVLLCRCSKVWAQADLPFSHQAWSTDEGLPDVSVHQVLQSRVGYLWIATEGGAARFDGTTFSLFRHDTEPAFTSDDVSSIAEDRAGRLWFGTADGLLEQRGTSFSRFTEKDGLPSPHVVRLAAAGDGSLLVLTDKGLLRWRDGRPQPLPPDLHDITGIEPVRDGSVAMFTSTGEVLRYGNGQVALVGRRPAAQGPVLAVQQAANGAMLVAGAHSLDEATPKEQPLWPLSSEQRELRVTAFVLDGRGTGWIGTNHGLYRRDLSPGGKTQAVEALRGDAVLALTVDREGDLWVGTESSGLHVLRPRAFRAEASVAGEAVTAAVAATDGSLWVGTRDSGIRHILRDGTTQMPGAGRLTSPRILSLAQGQDGGLWVGTPDGLNHLSAAGAVQTYTSADGLPDDFVRSLLVDPQGTVWAGTRRGLARISKGQIGVLSITDGLPSDGIGPMLEGAPGTGQIWLGTSNGLALLRDGRVQPLATGGHAIVTALAADGAGGLWAGVHAQGLYRWTGKEFRPVTATGLPSEIAGLSTDALGFLWLRGPQGVYRVSNAALLACTDAAKRCTPQVKIFGLPDGLPSETLAAEGSPVITQTPTGQLWFATRKGLATTDPLHMPPNEAAPPVVVQHVVVDGVELTDLTAPLDVGPGHSRYVFGYAALSYRMPSRVRYRYRLDGFDHDWVDAGPARSAFYTRLAPGHYRFRVLAEEGEGGWSDPGATLLLHVQPPFYRRWWFYVLGILLLATVLITSLRLREHVVQRRFALVLEERNRMAREIHDTLAQDFVSVSLQLDLAANLLRSERVADAASQLQATRALVKEGLQAARQSIWNLRANAGETSLPVRLTRLVARYPVEGKPSQLVITGAFRALSASVEEEVLRVGGEALSNVERHAGATEANVELRYEPEALVLRVRDNGRGFVPEQARHADGHYGVRGLYERAESLGAELRIVSSPGAGTDLRLRVPLGGKEVIRS